MMINRALGHFEFYLTHYFVAAYQPGGQLPISSTNKKVKGHGLMMPSGKELGDYSEARALRTEEIPHVVNDFRLAARNAIAAGKLVVNLPAFKTTIEGS